ncbi:hypothetical protein Hanom_Chr13g01222651 [Helianthus anomalus]
MELTNRMKMAIFQTFWIRMHKNKPLDESRKTGHTSGTKMGFYSILKVKHSPDLKSSRRLQFVEVVEDQAQV